MFRKYAHLMHLILLCAVFTLTACGVRDPQVTDKDIQAKGAELRELTSSRADAVRQLFAGQARSGHGLRVTFYSNNVMEVREE